MAKKRASRKSSGAADPLNPDTTILTSWPTEDEKRAARGDDPLPDPEPDEPVEEPEEDEEAD